MPEVPKTLNIGRRPSVELSPPVVDPNDMPVAPQLRCNCCQTVFALPAQQPGRWDHEANAHTPAQWDAWATGAGYAAGAPYPHWTPLDATGAVIPPASTAGPANSGYRGAPIEPGTAAHGPPGPRAPQGAGPAD